MSPYCNRYEVKKHDWNKLQGRKKVKISPFPPICAWALGQL